MAEHLGRRDNDGAVIWSEGLAEELDQRDVLVARSRRGVDQQEVELSPIDIGQKLLDQSVLAGPAPDERVVVRRRHEADRHHPQLNVLALATSLGVRGHLLHIHWRPA